MTKRGWGGLAAAVLALGLIAPAAAEVRSEKMSPQIMVVAQASSESVPPTRRSRKRSEARSPKEPTASQMAARERQKKCSAEWKTAKANGSVAGMKWPKFWSQCNARLKGNSA